MAAPAAGPTAGDGVVEASGKPADEHVVAGVLARLEAGRDGYGLALDLLFGQTRPSTIQMLRNARETREKLILELQVLAARSDGPTPGQEKDLLPARSAWSDLGRLGMEQDPVAVLAVCERAGEETVSCFEAALIGDIPDDLRRMLYDGIREIGDERQKLARLEV
jgi:hypothetical protein